MNNIIVVVPDDYEPAPKDCPICRLAFRDVKDVIMFKNHGCCTTCNEIHRYPNREKWENGWRPDN